MSIHNDSKIKTIIVELAKSPNLSDQKLNRIFVKNPNPNGKVYSKSQVLDYFNAENIHLTPTEHSNFIKNITMKKTRTLSGVTTVTVLTKPFPCPGKCIFCPNDVKMPKSYISSEPGAQRAKTNLFDPYLQTFNRLFALKKIGHPTDKVELIVLGGTWTSYPESYQIWFIKRCFDAMNDFERINVVQPTTIADAYNYQEIVNDNGYINYNLSVATAPVKTEIATWDELFDVQNTNITSKSRCVGLSIETRPDEINEAEVLRIRKLGATKVQIGVQSLDDEVLLKNRRGHNKKQTALAFELLRSAGFKIQAHYMPNLYGSTPENDITDFAKLFKDKKYRPDEIKLYPCSLIDGTELMTFYKQGKWRPYSKVELLHVLTESLKKVPLYCRVTRVIRDIPSQEIVDGNKFTNLRQDAESGLKGLKEIRSREIKGKTVNLEDLLLKEHTYQTKTSIETFYEFTTKDNLIVGFLRLSFPIEIGFIEELKNCAIIREVHVYGSSLEINHVEKNAAQHIGIGTKLINQAIFKSQQNNFKKLAVISSIGTRKYYEKFGFIQQDLYQVLDIKEKDLGTNQL